MSAELPTDPPADSAKQPVSLAERVGAQTKRKLASRRAGAPTVWSGLGMMGLIGWSVVVPTLLGAALGQWLDRDGSSPHSWTLALLVAGLVIGCVNAWRWVAKEQAAMREEPGGEND